MFRILSLNKLTIMQTVHEIDAHECLRTSMRSKPEQTISELFEAPGPKEETIDLFDKQDRNFSSGQVSVDVQWENICKELKLKWAPCNWKEASKITIPDSLSFIRIKEWTEKPVAPAIVDSETEVIFVGLAKIWRDSTGGLSTTSRKFTHPTYKAILRMGPEIVPFILREFQQRPDWWFDALEYLTKENPAEGTNSFEEATAAWIRWGKDKQII